MKMNKRLRPNAINRSTTKEKEQVIYHEFNASPQKRQQFRANRESSAGQARATKTAA
jgi:hypothetical protein